MIMQNKNISRTTLQQGRAEFAYKCVQQVLDLNEFPFESKKIRTNKKIIGWYENELKKKGFGEEEANLIIIDFIKNAKEKYKEYSHQLKADPRHKENNEGNNSSESTYSENNLKKAVVELYKNYIKEYKAYAKRVPMLIKNNGAGATLAYLKAKAKADKGNACELLYDQTAEWLKNSYINSVCSFNNHDLVGKMVALDSPEYRAVTNEILMLFTWIKRFVDGFIEDDEEGAENDE